MYVMCMGRSIFRPTGERPSILGLEENRVDSRLRWEHNHKVRGSLYGWQTTRKVGYSDLNYVMYRFCHTFTGVRVREVGDRQSCGWHCDCMLDVHSDRWWQPRGCMRANILTWSLSSFRLSYWTLLIFSLPPSVPLASPVLLSSSGLYLQYNLFSIHWFMSQICFPSTNSCSVTSA